MLAMEQARAEEFNTTMIQSAFLEYVHNWCVQKKYTNGELTVNLILISLN